MSQSPTEAGEAGEVYASAWTAINKLIRRGYSWSGRERNCTFLNVGDGSFARVDAVSGFGYKDDSRAVSRIDWDLDGDLDLFVVNRNGPRVRFFRNDTPVSDGFVAFRLRGVTCNRDAIGARVDLHLGDGRKLVRSLRAGEGYLAQSSSWVHFGLGSERVIDRVVVRWPGGEAETFRGIEAGRHYRLVQAEGLAERWEPPRLASVLEPSPPVPPPASGRTRVVLPIPLPMPRLVTETQEGRIATIYGIQPNRRSTAMGRPALLTLWASWCAPCIEELSGLAKRAAEIEAAGLALVALGVEPKEERDQAEAKLKDLGWPHPVVYAPTATIEVLDVLQGLLMDRDTRIPLPTSWLVDENGELVVIYFGPVEVDVLLEDLALLTADPAERLAASSPFEGAWMREPVQLEFSMLETRFASRGLPATAREYQIGNLQVREGVRAQLLYGMGRTAGMDGRLDEAIGYLRQAIEEDPRFVEAWSDLGIALYSSGLVSEAVDAYGQALLLDPERADTRLNLGYAYVALGDREQAEAELAILQEADHPMADDLARWVERMDRDDR